MPLNLLAEGEPVENIMEIEEIPHFEKTIENTIVEATDPTPIQSPSTTEPNPSNYCTVVKKVKKENVTPENIGEIVLCQIPGISAITAIAIMKKFSTFPNLMKELQSNQACLDDVTYETKGKIRKISKPSVENIKKYFL